MINDEQVDIVDEVNNVLYQSTKFEAHQKGLLHRTVIGMVRTSDNNIILVKQSSDRQDAGQFVSPVGGHVTAGETEAEALKREAFEETGIENFKYKLMGKKVFNREVIGRKENHFFIVYEITYDGKLVLNEESESYESFTNEELVSELKDRPEKFGDAYKFVYQNFYIDP